MEIASALVLTAASVTVVCMTEEPLPALGADIGAAELSLSTEILQKFEAKGVKILVNTTAKSFQGSDQVNGVVLDTGATLEADVVVVGIVGREFSLEANAFGPYHHHQS
ncbi:pyridine nucleotide-disulfide oxidoreductase [Teladorsagia circumcincta]|uniref:Pyridine nucleotide-disulfide oxidoreductase n=1 Tax=Teladorsagia circumcincta TaxID=45464 RepID=A0A2G9T476_TELCI|nr:pyridine nucleotide-disulfide oxidoreductase [Teladorsagia circumcincta]